ncbi:MAG: ATP-dependent DNA helicase RecG [Bacteroidales bacterium]|jgi:predicted HTH transcriptional regulator|nr:putative DNA binding domain-containing protein [Bacteroidales bacterium]MCK9498542.1 putative DNA binding domain-containing protein [Bacteroidales bacterium]MDY0315091.1 putative DNA binding domain-containing protein [Bacteroidales bacterium]NLB86978.1 ATP-dependent DNA helicase RecG [Bacteroidales bacterium]NLB87009.1 ATP-dependent DNA helicase RecG [Bacteroidales bacterium]
MNAIELLDIISSGETSRVQFKKEMDNDDSIAAELIAFSNSKGGVILFGIEDKKGTVLGLDYQKLQSYNNRIATIANDKVKPQIFLFTEVVSIPTETDEKKILLVEVSEGIAKPYKDKNGAIWIKQGSDKRRLTDNNEQIRLFQQSGILYLDEMIVPQTSVDDINFSKVEEYVKAIQKRETDEKTEISETLLTNLNILKDRRLTLGGLLFFANNPQKYRPAFCVKAISFFGNSIGSTDYRSNQDIEGTIPEIFEETMRFFTTNLHHIQAGQNFNSVGQLEVSKIALEELLQNALVHRDYSKNSPVRVMIFDDRIEIVSPGSLPNSLSVENIKMGNATVRNNLLVSYCSKLMIYRGFGSGITRSLAAQPNIELINDTDGEQFRVIIPRPEKK